MFEDKKGCGRRFLFGADAFQQAAGGRISMPVSVLTSLAELTRHWAEAMVGIVESWGEMISFSVSLIWNKTGKFPFVIFTKGTVDWVIAGVIPFHLVFAFFPSFF